MRRWYYAALVNRTCMHDRHAGEPYTVKPVYGEDSASDTSSGSSDSEVDGDAGRTCEVTVVTWNTKARAKPQFVLDALQDADVVCLQEVTSASTDWLSRNLAAEGKFTVITQAQCGGAWTTEAHGLAVVVRTERFDVKAQQHKTLTSDQERSLLTVQLRPKGTRMSLLVGTAHLESGAEGARARKTQVAQVREIMRDKSADGAVFAGDLNLREKEVSEMQIPCEDDSVGQTTSALGLGDDAWVLAGEPKDRQWTWSEGELPQHEHLGPETRWGPDFRKHRFDRMLVRGRSPAVSKVGEEEGATTLRVNPQTFALRRSLDTDHRGVQCTLTLSEAREKQKERRRMKLGAPLRVGARGRVGTFGVARRPTKNEACAKVEPHTEHTAGGAVYYCGKHFEKPRIRTGDAAILEDERRPGLWRLHLPRNCAHVNGHLVALAICLGANTDAQPVLTAKGVADYVCKYITKYGAGQSVSARIASLLDDIVSRVPEGKTMTVASLLAKAFIATAVPDTLCCLEAWHVLWALPRAVHTRFFKPLNMDGLIGIKAPKDVERQKENDDQAKPPRFQKVSPVQLYAKKEDMKCLRQDLKEALPAYNLLRFSAEVDVRDGVVSWRKKARVMKLKPYLQLDVTKPTAAKHAKMALRLLRPFGCPRDDPMNLSDEAALEQLEAFAQSGGAPRWFRKRFQHHNREKRRRAQGLDQADSAAAAAAPQLRRCRVDGCRKRPPCRTAAGPLAAVEGKPRQQR